MSNETMRKFGYPGTLVREYEHWALLVRPAQVTLGSLILAATGDSTRYGDLSAEAFTEQRQAVVMIEQALSNFCQYERINYLMLMMVDPHVHFHVIPRYSGSRDWQGVSFADQGWPGPPQLQSAVKMDEAQLAELKSQLEPFFAG